MKQLYSGITLNVISIIISLIAIPFLLRNLSLESYGKLTFFSVTCGYAYIFDMGSSRFLVKKLSASAAHVNSIRVFRLIIASVCLLTIWLFLVALLADVCKLTSIVFGESFVETFFWLYPILVASLLQRSVLLRLQSEEKNRQYILLNFLLTLTTTLTTLPMSFYTNNIYLIIFVSGLFKCMILFSFISPHYIKRRRLWVWYKVLIIKSSSSFSSYFSNIVSGYFDKAMMAMFVPGALGPYMLANQVVEKATIIPTVHSSLSYKKFSFMRTPDFIKFLYGPHVSFSLILVIFLAVTKIDYGSWISEDYQAAINIARYLSIYYFFVGFNVYYYNFSIVHTNANHLMKIDALMILYMVFTYPTFGIIFGINGLMGCMIIKSMLEYLLHSHFYQVSKTLAMIWLSALALGVMWL